MSTTFSYAQAARRPLVPNPPAPQSVASQAASVASSQSRDAAPTSTTSAPSSVSPSTTSNDQDAIETASQPAAESRLISKAEPVSADLAKSEEPLTKAPISDASVLSQDQKQSDEALNPAERRSRNSSSNAARASSDVSDNRKARKGKKSKGTEKEGEQDQTSEKEKEAEAAKVQLSEAPIPSVNIWVQRAKEAQTKVTPQQPAPARSTPNPPAFSADQKSRNTAANEGAENAATTSRTTPSTSKPPRRDTFRDGTDQPPRRNAPRGSRLGDKSALESMPSVADVVSWPTPETAATETKTTDAGKPVENEETLDDKQESGQKGKLKWAPVPFVPTVKFETTVPSRTPRGGRTGGSRGGRDTGARGAHTGPTSSGDRAQASNPTRPSYENVNGTRSSVAPGHAAKRASIDASGNRDARKTANSREALKSLAPQQVNGTEDSIKDGQEDVNGITPNQELTNSDVSPNTEKRVDSALRSSDITRESAGQGKESSHHGAPKTERRGGGRGRGGHVNGQGHHHGSYGPNGQSFSAAGNSSSRQNSFPGNLAHMGFGPSSSSSNYRGQRNSTAGSFSRSGARGARGMQLAGQSNFSLDPSMHQMPQFPQQGGYGNTYDNSIMAMLVRQLTYYFSVNNLLKDSWLRKSMDSQGYVLLDVVLTFHRMRELAQDINLVKAACLECPEIELVTGFEDHRDRVRRINDWPKFVYPKGSRHEAVQYDDGPGQVFRWDSFHSYSPYPPAMPPYQMGSPSYYPPNGAPYSPYGFDPSQQYGMTNGMNGHTAYHDPTPLSATVPAFSPRGGSSSSEQERNAGLKAAGEDQSKNAALQNGDVSVSAGGQAEVNGQPHTNGVLASGAESH